MKIPQKLKSKKIYIFILLIILFIVLIDKIVFPFIVHRKNIVKVPYLYSLSINDASKILDSLELNYKIDDTIFSSKVKIGNIVLQSIDSNKLVKKGRTIYFAISGGKEKITVPSLIGKTLREAEINLNFSNFLIGKISYITSDIFPPGIIISQSPNQNTKILKDSYVNLTISKGSESDKILVPEIIGMQLNEAKKTLERKNFFLGKITFHPTLDKAPNMVLEQFPSSNGFASFGDSIDVFVSIEQKNIIEN